MKYTIFDVGEGRELFVHDTAYKLRNWERIPTNCVDGRNPIELKYALDASPYEVKGKLKVGQIGIWLTVLNALDEAPLITFENDALVNHMLPTYWNMIAREIPSDTDFVALFYPLNELHKHSESLNFGKWLARPSQRFGGVSMFYTAQGAERIKELVERDGMVMQFDDQLFHYSTRGELNAYTSRPDMCFVGIRDAESIVQNTELFNGNHRS